MKIKNSALPLILCLLFKYSLAADVDQCQYVSNIYKKLGMEIPECCNGESIVCKPGTNIVTELKIDYSKKIENSDDSITYENPYELDESIQLLTSLENFELTGGLLKVESIPDISTLKSLKSITVKNKFITKFPDGMFSLKSLEKVHFPNVRLTEIPEGLYNLTNLVDFNVNFNGIGGNLSDNIKNLKKLKNLDIGDNILIGHIPDGFCELEELEYVNIINNDLDGPIPENIGNLKKIIEINFENNDIDGRIPDSLGDLPNLKRFLMRRNSLQGPIPDSLGNLKSIEYLQLYGNELNGTIPESLGNMKTVIQLLLSRNRLTGTIPDSFGNLENIEQLILYNNELTGPIPDTLKNLKNLKKFDINYNNITGYLPDFFNDMEKLDYLYVGSNKNLYGYVINNPTIAKCEYERTNICYLEGTPSNICTTGASVCTSELIKKIERVKKGLDPDAEEECWAESIGYACCQSPDTTVVLTDADGEWGVEDNAWCGIPKEGEIVTCKYEALGYRCCSEGIESVYEDADGKWGVENGDWCGI